MTEQPSPSQSPVPDPAGPGPEPVTPEPATPEPAPAALAAPGPAPTTPTRPPRLLLVTSLYPTPDRPDIGAFVERRAAALGRCGVDVRVASNPDFRDGMLIRHVWIAWRALTARGRFDGVEGHVLYPTGLVAWLAARLRRRPLLVYAHGADVLEAARRNRFHRRLARFVARHADAVVTNSVFMAEAVAELGARASVIPPGVDFELFSPIDRAEARRLLDLDPGSRIALYVGHLIERKGADVFAAALRDAPGWEGWTVGGGVLEARLREAGTLHLHPAVEPDQVPLWLSAADVVVVPSRREPLGLAAVEALACGVPVIASATGGLLDTVEDGVNGLLVPPDDPAALAAALERLSDPALRARLAAAARESVRDHDMDRVTAAMGEVWARLDVGA